MEARRDVIQMIHSGEELPTGEKLTQEVAAQIFNTVESRYREEEFFIGKGQNAEVYTYPVLGVCAKVVVKIERKTSTGFELISGPKQKHLPLREEGKYLDVAYNLDGVVTPMPYATQRTLMMREKGSRVERVTVEILLQELMEGVSVRDLVDKDIDLPNDFNPDVFMSKLRLQIAALNKKVFHRDLHGGNVLVCSDGEPCLIDFGDAIYVAALSDSGNGVLVERSFKEGKNVEEVISESIDYKHLDTIEGLLAEYYGKI